MKINRIQIDHPAPPPGTDNRGRTAAERTPATGGKLPSGTLAGYLTARGLKLPPGFIQSLEAELTKAGLPPESLDRESALRALLLHRHGLPLTRAAVTGILSEQPSVLGDVVVLLDSARSVLASPRLSQEQRVLVQTLAGDLTALFSGSDSMHRFGFVLSDTLARWAYETEGELLSLFGEHNGQKPDTMMRVSESPESEYDYTLRPRDLTRLDPAARRFFDDFRAAVARLQEQIAGMDFGKADSVGILREAFLLLEAQFSSHAGLFQAGIAEGVVSEELAAAFMKLFGKRISILQNRLFLDGNGIPDTVWFENVIQTAGRLRQTGVLFEWRLLAWYRAGRNPELLIRLVREDLKGTLLEFMNRLREKSIAGKAGRALEKLASQASKTLGDITTNQLSNLAGRHGRERAVFLEVPLSYSRAGDRAQVKISEEETGKSDRDSGKYIVSFALETSALGSVTVFLRVSGKAISLECGLDRDEYITVGKNMADELTERLKRCGFAPGTVAFRRRSGESRGVSARTIGKGDYVA